MSAAPVELLPQWGISGVQAVTVPNTGTMNDTWVVPHEGGRVVLRRHRQVDEGSLAVEHDVISHVRACGIPAPRVLPLRSAGTVLAVDGRLYSVYDYAEGSQLPQDGIRPSQSWSMGTTLGLIHTALGDLPTGPVDELVLDDVSAVLARLDAVATAVKEESDLNYRRTIFASLQARAEWLSENANGEVEAPDDRRQLIDGDYQHTNLFFVGDRVSAVIDWDRSRWASPAVEVIRAMHHGLGMRPALCQAFLAGYRSARPLGADDLERAARWFEMQQARSLWMLEQVFIERNDRVRRQIFEPQPFVPFMDTWRRICLR